MYRCTSRGRLNRPLVVGLREEEVEEEEDRSNRSLFACFCNNSFLEPCNCKHWTLFSDFLPARFLLFPPIFGPVSISRIFYPISNIVPPVSFLFSSSSSSSKTVVLSVWKWIFICNRSSSIYEKCFDVLIKRELETNLEIFANF